MPIGRYRFIAFRKSASIALGAGMACIGLAAGCASSHSVTVEYQTKPSNPEILQSPGQPVRVCVDQVDVAWQKTAGGSPAGGSATWIYSVNGQTVSGQYAASYSHESRARSDQWVQYVRGELRAQLQQRAARSGIPIEVVSRDELNRVLEEKDLVKAGIVGRDRTTENVKVSPIDLLLVGTIEAKACVEDEIQGPSTGKRIGATAAGYVPWIGGFAQSQLSRPTREVRRTLTLGGCLRAVDAKTEHVFASESIARQVTHNPSHFGDESEFDMPPLDSEIKVALDDCIGRFLDRMLPGMRTITITYRVKDDETGRARVSAMQSDPKSAMALFEADAARDARDAEKQHAAGVACERAGDLGKARTYYQRAVELTDEGDEERNDYSQALERVRHLQSLGGSTVVMR